MDVPVREETATAALPARQKQVHSCPHALLTQTAMTAMSAAGIMFLKILSACPQPCAAHMKIHVLIILIAEFMVTTGSAATMDFSEHVCLMMSVNHCDNQILRELLS